MFSNSTWKKIGCFAGGVLFGTAGVKVLLARMQKKYIQIVQQRYCGQRTAS